MPVWVCCLNHWFSNSSNNFSLLFPRPPMKPEGVHKFKTFLWNISFTDKLITPQQRPQVGGLLPKLYWEYALLWHASIGRREKGEVGQCTAHTSEVVVMHTYILLLLNHHRLTDISRTVPASGPSLTLWSNLDKGLCYTLKIDVCFKKR